MKKLQSLIQKTSLKAFAAAMAVVALVPGSVFAQLRDGARQANPGTTSNLMSIFQTIANILLFLIGAVAVIMLIIGGFRFVVSGGDSGSVESARNTILYAIIGIIVAFLAYAAVNFVIDRLQ